MKNLSEWKNYANSLLSPAERIKDELREAIATIQNEHPQWVDSNDARWSWFTGAKKIIQTSQICYLNVRDQLSDLSWWHGILF